MPVLTRRDLESSPLADLHVIASEFGLESYRRLRKDDLIGAILDAQGGEPEAPAASADERDEPDEIAAPVVAEDVSEEAAEPEERDAPRRRPRRRSRSRSAAAEGSDPEPRGRPAREERADAEPADDEEPESDDHISHDEKEEVVAGVLDILANGSGFLRMDPSGQSKGDVYVSPAQIRRCELRPGDEAGGPARPPRRNERHPSLIRVETVNGREAEPAEERPRFEDLTPVFPSERLERPAGLEDIVFGKGSRVALYGPSGAGATRTLRAIAATLAERHSDIRVQVVLAGVRPEEVADWREGGLDVVGGSFDGSPDAHAQAGELAVERAKRGVERGSHVALLIDSLDGLAPAARRRLFGAGRATADGGSLTVIAAIGDSVEAIRWATTTIALEPDGRPVGDTLRAERL